MPDFKYRNSLSLLAAEALSLPLSLCVDSRVSRVKCVECKQKSLFLEAADAVDLSVSLSVLPSSK